MTQRILFVTTVALTAERFLSPLAEHFRSIDVGVDVAANGAAESRLCQQAFDRALDVPFSRRPYDPANGRAAFRLREILQSGCYDIVHVHTPVAGFVTRAAVASMGRSRPLVIYTAHGFHFHPYGTRLSNLAFLALEKFASRWTDYLVVINRVDQESALVHRLIPVDRLQLMPGVGIELGHFSPKAVSRDAVQAVRSHLHLGSDQPLFTLIGEFSREKRQRDAVAALAVSELPTAHLALAGVGRNSGSVAAFARQLHLRDRVHFLGYVRDVRPLLSASTAALLPSEREGLPRSVLEAMALGVPVIASDVRGSNDLLGGGIGFLHEVGNVASIARHMRGVWEDRAAAEGVATAARVRSEDFSIQRVIDIHEGLYADAIRR